MLKVNDVQHETLFRLHFNLLIHSLHAHIPPPAPTLLLSLSLTQHDEAKLDALLKEVAENEVPPGAPQPPPDTPDQNDGNEDDQMLPSQRDKTGQSSSSGLVK